MAVERTLVLVKPDAIARGLAGEIVRRIEARGMILRAAKLVRVDRDLAERHYDEHREKPFFGELVEFITSGPTLALVIEGESAISRSRCRTTSCTVRTRLSRPSARLACGSAPMSSSEPDSVAANRELWTRSNAEWTDARALQAWQRERITWGVWRVDESEVCALPDELAGLDVVELGCGTAYVSGWLARRGARPIGVDPTPAQLDSARRCQRDLGLDFPLVEAPAESVPLPDACAD